MLQVSKVLWQKTASPPFKSALSCENLDPIAHTNLSRNWLTYVLAVFQSLPVRQTYGPRYIKRSVAIGRIYALSDCIEFIGAIQINFIYLSVCLSVCLSVYLSIYAMRCDLKQVYSEARKPARVFTKSSWFTRKNLGSFIRATAQ